MENKVEAIVTDGIKNKERVKEFGEVFTPANIVRDMVDLIPVDEDKEKELLKTWLEPACGTGNFLVEILRRKLEIVKTLNINDIDQNILKAYSTIYAIDIQKDNVEESKHRMLEGFPKNPIVDKTFGEITSIKSWYKDIKGTEMSDEIYKSIKYILDGNVIHGNALTGRMWESNGQEADMVVPEWKFTSGNVDRNDILFSTLGKGTFEQIKYKYNGISYDKLYSMQMIEESDELSDDDF